MLVKGKLRAFATAVLFAATCAAAALACASGGPGSESCSLTGGVGCSVTCSAGYYACCNWDGGIGSCFCASK